MTTNDSRDSAFDLPERLKAKADPVLIGGDELRFAAIAEALAQQVFELGERLEAERRKPGGIGQGAMDRDLEIRRLSSRLRLLRRFGIDLCLGRMVPEDGGEPVYIGRLGLTDADGRRLLVDWRAPAAEPFFAATGAHPLGLASRRRYRWTRGRVSDYWDEAFTEDALENDAALDDQSAFIASLGGSRTARMRDVLSTIQADQDAIIRADSHGPLIVDGGPGTGKTVVALHRAAYLLYSEPRISSGGGGVLFVGPHQAYLDYVDDVLPSLGEDSVQICTLRDLVPEGAHIVDDAAVDEGGTRERDERAARLKASLDQEKVVERAVAYYEEPPTARIEIETPWGDVAVDRREWAEAFDGVEPGTPHNEGRAHVWEALLEILVDQLDDEDVPPHVVRRYLQGDDGLTATFAKAWPVLEPSGVVADLLSVPAYLQYSAPWLTADEVQALQRVAGPEAAQDARAWTVADLPLLDAARHRIGDPDAVRRKRRRAAALAAEREQRERIAEDLIAADDSELLLMRMLRGQDVQNSLVDEAGLPQTDPDTLAGPFAHVIVDEAQELTDAEWRMLLRRAPSRSITVVGDRAQARHGFTDADGVPESWEQRLARVGFGEAARASLSINYRTPSEIMAEAEPVIRAVLPDANVPVSVRDSGLPVLHAHVDALEGIVDEWSATHGEGVACVIGAPHVADTPRVRSLSPEHVKGLEFDLVVLVDPDAWGAVDHYVAMTRATQQLVVLRSNG